MDESARNQISPSKRSNEEEEEEIRKGDSSKRIKYELAAETEHFERLYETALEFIQKTMKVSDEELQNGMARVQISFRSDLGKRFTDVDWTKSDNLCGYFYRYSQLSTELSRCKILLALQNCKELQSHFNRVELNVISIGGGPGFDIVGLCSALYEIENTACQKLNLTVVDLAKRWESFLDIVRFLLREGNFGGSCDVFRNANANLKFLGVSAWDTHILPYSEALKEADVIVMRGLMSILYENESKAVEAVAAGMQKGAMLLVIDYTNFGFEKYNLEKIFSDSKNFETERRPPSKAYSSVAHITVFKKTGN